MVNQRNVLFQGIFVISYSHKEQDIMLFIEAFDSALTIYEKALDQGFDKFLEGEIIKPVFRKFN